VRENIAEFLLQYLLSLDHLPEGEESGVRASLPPTHRWLEQKLGGVAKCWSNNFAIFSLTPDPSPRGRGAKENRRKFRLQYLPNL